MKKINDLRAIEGGLSFTGSGLSGLVTPFGTMDFALSTFSWKETSTQAIAGVTDAVSTGYYLHTVPVLGKFTLTNAYGTFGWDLTGIFGKFSSWADFGHQVGSFVITGATKVGA